MEGERRRDGGEGGRKGKRKGREGEGRGRGEVWPPPPFRKFLDPPLVV